MVFFENSTTAAADQTLPPLKKTANHPTVEKTEKVSRSCFKEFFSAVANKICRFFKTVFCLSNDLSDVDPLETQPVKAKTNRVKKVRFELITNNSSQEKPNPQGRTEPSTKKKLPDNEEKVDPSTQSIPDDLQVAKDRLQAKKDRLQAKLAAIDSERLRLLQGQRSNPRPLPSTSPKKKLSKEELEERAAKEKFARSQAKEAAKVRARAACLPSLTQFCGELDLSVPNTQLLGLPQIGNNCYMNAGIQLLNTYAENHPGFLELLRVPLIPKDGESLSAFEKRVLKKWLPLEIERFETEEHYCDRILFKWSFLALSQAKVFGSEAAVKKALSSHHSLCFDLGLISDFQDDERRSQKDVGDYIVMWHQTMQFRPLTKREQNYCYHKGERVENPVRFTEESFLPISMEVISSKMSEEIEKQQEEIRKKYSKLEKAKDSEIRKLEKNSNKNKKKLKARKAEKHELYEKLQKELDDCSKRVKKAFPLECDALFKNFFADDGIMKKVTFISDEGAITPKRSLSNTKLGVPLPPEFLVQFKRYAKEKGKEPEKLKNPIDFKGLQIDIAPFVNGEGLPEKILYQMTGFVVHKGGMNSGHYVVYIKKGSKWYKCNDSTVTAVKKDGQLKKSKKAYFCLYSAV